MSRRHRIPDTRWDRLLGLVCVVCGEPVRKTKDPRGTQSGLEHVPHPQGQHARWAWEFEEEEND